MSSPDLMTPAPVKHTVLVDSNVSPYQLFGNLFPNPQLLLSLAISYYGQ